MFGIWSIYRKSVILQRNETYFFCEEQTLYGSARLGTEQVEHSMRGLVTKDGLTDAIIRAREQHGDEWQQRLQEQYEGSFYERLREGWGTEWSTRLDLLLQGNNDAWLIEQIRNESYTLQAGNKRFELSNHLGNVLAVVSDKKDWDQEAGGWAASVVTATDYYPFGMSMPGRSTDTKYKYGFNGKETDPETGIQDYGMRWYLPNIARFPSVDPITKKYPELTPYQFASNTPIMAIDLDGLEGVQVIDPNTNTTTIRLNVYYSLKGESEGGSGFTEKGITRIQRRLAIETSRQTFYDLAHKDEEGRPYVVKFEFNFIPVADEKAFRTLIGKEWNNPYRNGTFVQAATVKKVIINGQEGEERGATTWRKTTFISSRNGHTITHEFFHNLIQQHRNAPKRLQEMIDVNNQEAGHLKAGGIFIYENSNTGQKLENLNQQNINDVLETLPQIKVPELFDPNKRTTLAPGLKI